MIACFLFLLPTSPFSTLYPPRLCDGAGLGLPLGVPYKTYHFLCHGKRVPKKLPNLFFFIFENVTMHFPITRPFPCCILTIHINHICVFYRPQKKTLQLFFHAYWLHIHNLVPCVVRYLMIPFHVFTIS